MEHHWFTFTKAERRGIFLLLLILTVLAIIPRFYAKLKLQKTVKWEEKYIAFQKEIDSLENADSITRSKKFNSPKKNYTPKPYTKPKTPKPNSFKNQAQNKSFDNQSTPKVNNRDKAESTSKKPILVKINSATAEEYAQLTGIGEVLSNRIIKFRDALGGFYSVEQVEQTYGIEKELFQRIKTQLLYDPVDLKKLNLNTASASQLQSHPYISEKLAQQIINYREKVHPFENENDVLSLYFMDEVLYQKLKPYIFW